MFTGTKTEFATFIGVEYPTAHGLITYLLKAGLAKHTGKRKPPGGKGKPSDLYQIPLTGTFNFQKETQEGAA